MAHRFAPLLVAATAFAQTPLPGFNSTAQFMTSSATCSYFSVSVAVAAWQANASAIIALSPLTGQASVFVTAEYDGTAGTLPGPDSSVCQWQAAYTGAATTVVIAPGSSPCYDTLPTSSSVSAPVTFTLCVTSGPHSYAAVEWIVGAPGAAQAQPWGGAPTIQLGPFDPALVLDLAPVVFLAPPATAAPGASAGAVSIGILSSHVRGPPDFTAATNSLLVVATPQLADADVAVFVSLDSSPPPVCDVGAGGSSEVICSGWTWAFSTAAGGGALLIDALDPCTLSSLATLNGPPPAINTTACDAGNFMAAGSVWVLVVPLFAGGFPPPGSQPLAGTTAGMQPAYIATRSMPTILTEGFMPSAPLQLRDGSVMQSITSPYLMCPIRTSLGSCDGDPSTWVEASASVYAYADAAQQSYSLGAVTTLQVDRLCDSDPLSDGPGVGPCGPPLSVYLLSFPGGLPRVYGPPFATWPDAFDATSSFHFRPEDSSFVLHFDTPAGCCNPDNVNTVFVAVVANCSNTSAAPGSVTCPDGAVAARTLHRISFRTTDGIGSVGGGCLTARRACVIEDRLGGGSALVPYSAPGPQYRVFMPPLSIGPFLSFRIDVAVASSAALLYMCQSVCNGTTAAPSCSPETADVVLPVNASVGGVASVGPLDYIVNPAGCLYWTLGTVYAPGYVPDVSPRAYTGESTQPPVLFRVAVGCTPLFVLPPGPAAGGSPLPAPLEVLALNASSVSLSVPRPLLTPTAGSDACNAPAVGASAFSVSLTALPAGSFDTRFLLASPLGVREAVRSARGSGAWTPSAVIPAAATAGLPASAVTVAATIAGLLPCTAYVAVATVSCAKGDGCLPYLASDWSLAPESAAFVTPGDCAPPPQSPAGKAGLTSAQAAGVAVGVLALVGALAGVAWWRLRGCPCGGGAALRFKPGWGGAASAEPLHSGVGSVYAEMGAGGY